MTSHLPPEVQKVLLEALLVLVLGAAFALAANEISPRGLALTRNYFPGAERRSPSAVAALHPAPGAGATNYRVAVSSELISARLNEKGLQGLGSNRVAQLFHDLRYEQELVVFIDARNDREYQEGHIPGAYQFDHYHAENYLPAVFPVCGTAEQIVVYCNGGDCEDSEFAAITLSEAGIPKTKLFVYVGGFIEWATNGLPIETGLRKSGNLRPAKP